MPATYDNWARLVAAVVRKQQLWELFHQQSISTVSSDSSFSFQLSASSDDDMLLTFSSPIDSAPNQRGCFRADSVLDATSETSAAERGSSILIENQSSHFQANPSSFGNVSLSRRKRNLFIQVPRLQVLSETHLDYCPRIHTRAGGKHSWLHCDWPDYAIQESHPLPLPPMTSSNSTTPSTRSTSAGLSPSTPCSPRIVKTLAFVSPWKKGTLLGNGEYGNVYTAFNSNTGELCAMEEVFLVDDEASLQVAMKLGHKIGLLSSLMHPNIIRYYKSEKVNNVFYVYTELVSSGCVSQILKQYGNLGESALRSYTQQILLGLVYLHSRHVVHRNIKAASIFIGPNGCVKLCNFGLARHRHLIADHTSPLWRTDSPYWRAPEVLRNPNICNPAIDIWSLGCTVLEMATARPPWSQYDEGLAVLMIMNRKELPLIPDYLSDEGKDFVMKCLQWHPLHRPTAAQLLEHPFAKSVGLQDHAVLPNAVNMVNSSHKLESERLALHSFPESASTTNSRKFSSPVSPVVNHLQHPRSPQPLNAPASSSSTLRRSATYMISRALPAGETDSIPYQYLNPSTSWQERFHSLSPSSTGIRTSFNSKLSDPLSQQYRVTKPVSGCQLTKDL